MKLPGHASLLAAAAGLTGDLRHATTLLNALALVATGLDHLLVARAPSEGRIRIGLCPVTAYRSGLIRLELRLHALSGRAAAGDQRSPEPSP